MLHEVNEKFKKFKKGFAKGQIPPCKSIKRLENICIQRKRSKFQGEYIATDLSDLVSDNQGRRPGVWGWQTPYIGKLKNLIGRRSIMIRKTVTNNEININEYVKDNNDTVCLIVEGYFDWSTRIGGYKIALSYDNDIKVYQEVMKNATSPIYCILIGIKDVIEKMEYKQENICIIAATPLGFKGAKKGKGANVEHVQAILDTLEEKQCNLQVIEVKGGGNDVKKFINSIDKQPYSINPKKSKQTSNKVATIKSDSFKRERLTEITKAERELIEVHISENNELGLFKIVEIWKDKDRNLCVAYENGTWYRYSVKAGKWWHGYN